MSFLLLASHLHATALAAQRYFTNEHGAKNFQHEAEVANDLSLKPTLFAKLSNGNILCVEVSEKAYSNSLDTFVVECSTRAFPVKLYVAVPSARYTDFSHHLHQAKERGVGVIEVREDGSDAFADAVSLSLFGVRKIQINEFPKGKREAVRLAEQTFLNGNPVKGCQSLYEELEAVSRAFAMRSKDAGWWRAAHKGETRPSVNLSTGPWAKVLKELGTFLDMKACRRKCPAMREVLISSARGLTDPRNLTSHKPKDIRSVTERDRKLRTWFESTSDLLKEWFEATKPLKL